MLDFIKLFASVAVTDVPLTYLKTIFSGLVQRILTCDASRLRDRAVICAHLLNPLTLGLASNELSAAYFEELISTVRILIDIMERLWWERTDTHSTSIPTHGLIF